MFVVQLLIGLVMLVAGAEMLVRGGGHVAIALRVPVLIVGLTIVAFGTSMPELVVSTTAALDGSAAIALGNVTGSNIANVLLILGASALVSPLRVDRRLMARDVPSLVAMQIGLLLMCIDGRVGRIDGALLALAGVVYNVWLVRDALRRRASAAEDADADEIGPPKNLVVDVLLIVAGLAVIVIGADQFVTGAVTSARIFGLSERFIGLTVVALGTSMPELATSVVAAYRGEVDISIGNVLGSNIFNIVAVLGITALIMPIPLDSSRQWFDLGIALGVALLLVPIVTNATGRLGRVPGGLMIASYLAFLFLAAD